MKTAAPDFKIFWDEAYIVHHLTEEIIETPVLLNVSKKYGTQDRVFMFTSTSKITFRAPVFLPLPAATTA